jgi:Ran GTPase-activating protein (RanGAP) involved in mRNA processing and transport
MREFLCNDIKWKKNCSREKLQRKSKQKKASKTRDMHGDVLATRNVDGSTIQYVEAVDGVQTAAAGGLRVSSSSACGRKRREEEMMDIVTNGKEEEEDFLHEEEEEERRTAKRRVGEIASGMAKMRLMMAESGGSFGFTEGKRTTKADDVNAKMDVNENNGGNNNKRSEAKNAMMVKIRADMSKYANEDEVWDEIDRAIRDEHKQDEDALWACSVVRLQTDVLNCVSLDKLFRLSSRPMASARARRLIALHVSGCRDKAIGFGRDLASSMANLPMLREFSAVGTNLGKAFITRFAHVTHTLKHLEILKLSANKVAEDIDACEALMNAIENLASVKFLDLSQNYLGERGMRAVCEGMVKRRQRPIDQFGKRPEALKVLIVSHDSIGNNGAVALANMFRTFPDEVSEKLDVSFNGIFEQGATALAEAMCWQSSGMRSLRSFRRVLDFRCNSVGFEGASALAKCLDGTRSLNLSNNGIKDAGLKMLSKHLKTNFTLTHFDVRGNEITSDGAFYLAECLSENSTLLEISLDSNRLDDRAAIDFAESLSSNLATRLSILDLARNDIEDEGGIRLANFLATNVSLARLSLSSNRLSAKGARTCEDIAGLRIDVNWQK